MQLLLKIIKYLLFSIKIYIIILFDELGDETFKFNNKIIIIIENKNAKNKNKDFGIIKNDIKVYKYICKNIKTVYDNTIFYKYLL